MAEYLDVGADGAVRVDESAGVAKVWLVTSPGGANLDLPRLRALIAELTRRAALLAGEAGEAPARIAEDERAAIGRTLAGMLALWDAMPDGSVDGPHAAVMADITRALDRHLLVSGGHLTDAGRALVARWSGPHASADRKAVAAVLRAWSAWSGPVRAERRMPTPPSNQFPKSRQIMRDIESILEEEGLIDEDGIREAGRAILREEP